MISSQALCRSEENEMGSRGIDLIFCDLEPRTPNLEPRTSNPEPRTQQNQTRNLLPVTRNR